MQHQILVKRPNIQQVRIISEYLREVMLKMGNFQRSSGLEFEKSFHSAPTRVVRRKHSLFQC